MSEGINEERKKLYEKSAEYLELFIKNIPDDKEKVFYSRQIFQKINLYVRDDYMSEFKDKLDESARNGKGLTISSDDLVESLKKFETNKTKSN